ncbi:MAG: hypothetical protein NTZ49_02710 [Candidatus Parcubacteria bacterium]|nr:hypothetical protein [Candidatus Parcubacteria bacterium]
MNSNIFSELVKKYNIQDVGTFSQLAQTALSGEVEAKKVGYSLHKVLNMDIDAAIDLSVEMNLLPEKDKASLLEELKSQQAMNFDLQTEIKALIAQSDIYPDEIMTDRLVKLILSYLQDIRDEIEFKDSLLKSEKIGGVGLGLEAVEKLLQILRIKKADWQKRGIDLKQQTVQPVSNVSEQEIDVAAKPKKSFDLLEQIAPKQETNIEDLLKERGLSLGKTAAPLRQAQPDLVEEIMEEEDFLQSQKELPAPQANTQAPLASPAITRAPEPIQPVMPVNQPMVKRNEPKSRPQFSDVKFEPKLYGPVDELAALTLTDFRRLSKDPIQAVQKIADKLEILEGESVVKRSQGVLALKSSPLYKVYAEIMNKSLLEGKSFEQVIKERGDLTLVEFKAIMELNKSLKY